MSKKYTTNFLEDTNGSTGTTNQVLVSTATGVDWVDGSGSGIIGGPYLPLTAGASYPLTGDLLTSGNIYLNNNKTIFGKNTSGSNYGLLTITSGNIIKLGAYAYTSAATQIGLGDNGSFLIGSNTVMKIDSSGNVGIGTTGPLRPLDVGSTTTGDIFRIWQQGQNTYTSFDVVADSDATTPRSLITFREDANPATHLGTQKAVIGWYNPWNAFTIGGSSSANGYFNVITQGANAGNVGINTTSPLGKLQVNEYTVASQGNQGVHGEVSVFADNGDESLFLGLKDSAYPNRGWAINPVAFGVNSSLQFKEHGSTGVRMVIESGGFVGLGVTDPTEKLHLQSTTSGCFIRFADQTASGVYVGSRNDELEIYAGNAERMGIDATGVVRFNAYNDANNTGTPTYLLGTDGSGNM
jgi:hypothetical protein